MKEKKRVKDVQTFQRLDIFQYNRLRSRDSGHQGKSGQVLDDIINIRSIKN